ncbi:organomercurial lyase [Janthinobacterium sp. Marseille]|uniref:Alkylmercury lyase n=1 Tax=Herminiimonas contaminans TaxID=1111140 RepID=A0ABS0EW53_9BURK|nr:MULTISPECIES: organomercurial lyase [Oxalobacteraceae]ABR91914.1 organomercurial lyase [Janthinobacterium sp. Marseille]MBF8179079.1 alkylmercury lyase [Herminiimonas contaminans]MBX9800263.1 alkylmercury lyase family protein [Burkholderiaceae bacterium]
MNISTESRLGLKAAVTCAQQKLAYAFPLQARIEDAHPTLQSTYARILGHWIHEAAPPAARIFPQAVLDALCAMDAIAIGEQGIGCYPFSARQTEIHVHFAGKSVHAMCAIDALAIPRMVRQAARITARCVVCRCHLACSLAANGSVEKEHQNPEAARVVWESGAGEGQACCNSLCVNINFVCRHCTTSPGALIFSLPQAAAMGNAFFSFQRRLLGHYST